MASELVKYGFMLPRNMTGAHMAKDRFHEYLDYCEANDPISPGDFIELVGDKTTLAWSRLIIDLRDTWQAGRLERVKTSNGGCAYVRPTRQSRV